MAKNINFLNNNTVGNINTNFQRVNDALEDVVARSGELPNNMEADLDMDGNDIINVGLIQVGDISVSGEDLTGILTRAEEAVQEAEDQANYAEEWAQSLSPISVAAGGDGSTDRSSKWWAQEAEAISIPDGSIGPEKLQEDYYTKTETDGLLVATLFDESVTRSKLNISLRSIVGFQYDTLADLEADTVPADVLSVRVVERVAGNGGGAFWSRSSGEPDVPALAKTQDADGTWWKLEPENGIVTPEMFGAQGGLVIDPYTRTIFDSITAVPHDVYDQHLRLLDDTVKRFRRAGVSYSVAVSTGGKINFSTSGTGVKLDAFNYIVAQYNAAAPLFLTEGRIVTATELDAVDAIDADETTAAMLDFIAYISHGRAKGVLGPVTYVVNQTLRPRFDVEIEGTRWRSAIRMASDVGYNHPVIQLGDEDEPSIGVQLRNFTVDFNLARVSGSAGGAVNDAPLGTAVSACYATKCLLSGLDVYDAYKHCIDVTGAVYGRTGTPLNTGSYSTQLARDFVVENCTAEGSGDDLITTHMCINGVVRNNKVAFSRGVYTNNSNGYECDDFSRSVTWLNNEAMYCYAAMEIKGHPDAKAARSIIVNGLKSLKTTNGLICRHNDHGQGTTSDSAFDLNIDNVVIESPLEWISGDTRQALRIYAYAGVLVGSVKIIQGDASADYYGTGTGSAGVVGIFFEGRDINFGAIEITGFAASNGVRITSSSAGGIAIGSIVCINGPFIAVYFSGGAKLAIGTYLLRGTSAASSVGIRGINQAANIDLGAGLITNYATATDIT